MKIRLKADHSNEYAEFAEEIACVETKITEADARHFRTLSAVLKAAGGVSMVIPWHRKVKLGYPLANGRMRKSKIDYLEGFDAHVGANGNIWFVANSRYSNDYVFTEMISINERGWESKRVVDGVSWVA